MRNFLATLAAVTLLVLLMFTGLRLLHLTSSTLLDWIIGIGIFWWLAAVVVLPWNAHFAARQVLDEARLSAEKGIAVNPETVAFAGRLARRFLVLAVTLHLLSALGLYLMAYFQVTSLGYVASAAALLLTLARPAQRAYEHLTQRLQSLTHQIRYPREDVVELQNRVDKLTSKLRQLNATLNLKSPESWAHQQDQSLTQMRQQLDRLDGRLEELIRQNSRDHEALARQAATDIARLSEDAQFLNQVRELIRFVKSA